MKRIWCALRVIGIAVLGACSSPDGGSGETGDGETQELALTVTDDGFTPTPSVVQSGVPLTLHVTRLTNNTCAREIVISGYGINRALPLNQEVDVELTPGDEDINYACAMGMIRGVLTVE